MAFQKRSTLNTTGKYLLIFVIILTLLSASISWAEDGITDKEILIGMSNGQSGPTSAVSILIKEGASVYFNKVNAAGGVGGRKIKLLVYDDVYQPAKAIENTRKLIEEEKVFVLFGYIGSPISAAIMPIFERAGVPYLFPLTGARFLRHPVNRYAFTLRASYAEEIELMVERLTEDLQIKKIGVFAQDDALGEAGRSGVLRALRKRNLTLAGDGTFERNTVDVDEAMERLMKANPEAVIMIAPYTPSAAFLKKAKARRFLPQFLHLGVGTTSLIAEAGKEADGLIATQVVPNPADSPLPIVKGFVSEMKAAGLVPDLISLEGYLDAKVLVEALKKTSPLTRDNLLSTLENLSIDAGGLKVSFSPTDHQGLHQVFLTKIENGKVRTIQDLK